MMTADGINKAISDRRADAKLRNALIEDAKTALGIQVLPGPGLANAGRVMLETADFRRILDLLSRREVATAK